MHTFPATTVIFSVVDSLLFNPAPFRDSDRLVEFLRWSSRGGAPMQPASMVARWRDQSHLFEQVEAHWESPFTLTGVDRAEIVWGSQVTVGLVPMLGVAPPLGRQFAPDEAAASIALISHGFWRRRYGESRDVAGQTIRLDDRVYTIVGVMPDHFRFPVSRVSRSSLRLLLSRPACPRAAPRGWTRLSRSGVNSGERAREALNLSPPPFV